MSGTSSIAKAGELLSYETLSQLARYWFAGLILFILYCIIVASVREARYHRQLQALREQGDFPQCLYVDGLQGRRWPSWEGRRLELYDDNVVGHDKGCDIVIAHQSVMGRHARIYRQGRQFYIECLDNQDVMVNGGLMETDAQWQVEDGDQIQLGLVQLTVVLTKE